MTLNIAAIDHVLFDLDGTLIDSSALHAKAFQTVIDEHRPKLGKRFDYDSIRGMTTYEVFESLGVPDPDEIRTLTALKQHLYRTSVENGELQPMEGAMELLEWLVSRGIGVHLVTGSSSRSAGIALQSARLDRVLGTIVTADDVAHGKPAPDGYSTCVQRIQSEPKRCLAVEDATNGIDSAHAAGLIVVGVFDPTAQPTADYWFSDLLSFHSHLSEPVEATA